MCYLSSRGNHKQDLLLDGGVDEVKSPMHMTDGGGVDEVKSPMHMTDAIETFVLLLWYTVLSYFKY